MWRVNKGENNEGVVATESFANFIFEKKKKKKKKTFLFFIYIQLKFFFHLFLFLIYEYFFPFVTLCLSEIFESHFYIFSYFSLYHFFLLLL